MTGQRLRPPPSIWASRVENVEHQGIKRPDLWNLWLATLDVLRDTAGPEAEKAATSLEGMLRSPILSESLVIALLNFKTRASDPIAGARARRGDTKRLAERTRISRSLARLIEFSDELLALGDELVLAALAIEHREGAPRGTDVRKAVEVAWLRLNSVIDLAREAENAAPQGRGRQPKAEVLARLKLVASVYRSYRATENIEPDAAFWAMFRALWTVLTGQEELPDEQRLREHLRDEVAVRQSTMPIEKDKS